MPPIKKKSSKQFVAESVAKNKTTQQQLSIEDRLTACAKKEHDSIIYIGMLVERILTGEFGAILKALTAGRTASELAESRRMNLTADRVLGRLEMADTIWNDLEQYVLDKDECLKPIPQDAPETYTFSA